MLNDQVLHGTLARKLPGKLYGFVYCPATNLDYFLHANELDSSWEQITVGDTLTFVGEKTPKGLRAKDASVIQRISV